MSEEEDYKRKRIVSTIIFTVLCSLIYLIIAIGLTIDLKKRVGLWQERGYITIGKEHSFFSGKRTVWVNSDVVER